MGRAQVETGVSQGGRAGGWAILDCPTYHYAIVITLYYIRPPRKTAPASRRAPHSRLASVQAGSPRNSAPSRAHNLALCFLSQRPQSPSARLHATAAAARDLMTPIMAYCAELPRAPSQAVPTSSLGSRLLAPHFRSTFVRVRARPASAQPRHKTGPER